jgi:hypothetical protein
VSLIVVTAYFAVIQEKRMIMIQLGDERLSITVGVIVIIAAF